MKIFLHILPLLSLLLAACAGGPAYDTRDVVITVTPQQAIAEYQHLKGEKVLWGGVIINSTNLQNSTLLEILAYPLDSNQKPNQSKRPLGRFLAEQQGYLETMDYTDGKLVTVTGSLISIKQGRVGESDYQYPLIDIENIYLWPDTAGTGTRPSVHFGVGVIFSN